MSLLCTGGPGRRGLDPAESCDISWAWRHGPWPSTFFWTWELLILDLLFRTEFINQPCLGPMTLTRCSCMCGLFDSFRTWVFQDLGGQMMKLMELHMSSLENPVMFSSPRCMNDELWSERKRMTWRRIQLWTWQIPTLTLRFGGGGFCEPFCRKECDEDLDIFKLLECRMELDTFLVLYLHFRGVDHPKSSEFNCFVVSLCGGLWKQMSYFTKTYSISLVVESLTMGPEHPNSPDAMQHLDRFIIYFERRRNWKTMHLRISWGSSWHLLLWYEYPATHLNF